MGKREFLYRHIIITLKKEGNFVLKIISLLFGGWKSGSDVESKLEVSVAFELNVVVRY